MTRDELLECVLRVARAEVGTLEDPPGSNRGARVETYLQAVGLPPGNPWCAAFVAWCFARGLNPRVRAEVPQVKPWPMVGGCATLDTWARRHKLLQSQPRKGDVFLYYAIPAGEKQRRACHTGLVTRVEGAFFSTIEGNTNREGGREGIGVLARRRRKGPNYRFIRWC